jgi:hypothetical protein
MRIIALRNRVIAIQNQRPGAAMRISLHTQTSVLPGGKIEITCPELAAGESVEVIVLPSPKATHPRPSAVDILAAAPGRRLFDTVQEVDDYIEQERSAWDR